MDLSGIEAIVFDLGGVLIDLDRSACIKAFERLGLHNTETLLSNYRQSGVFLQLEEGTVSPEDFRNELRKDTDRSVTDQELDEAFMQFLVELPLYKLQMVEELKKKYRIYALSNTNQIMIPYIMGTLFAQENKPISSYFDKMYLSNEMGTSKPGKKIFEMMINDSGMIPQRTLFVDDSEANCKTAKEMGFLVYCPKPKEDFRFLFGSAI